MPVSIIVSALVFLSACATTQHFRNASEGLWTPLQEGRGNGVNIFVDERSIKHVSDAVARLRIRYRYSSPKPFDSGYIEELVVYSEYDCKNKETYKILWSEAHFMDGGSKMDSSERLGYILPDDAVFRYVCK
jgi:Surface-adhesin protein E